MGSPVNTGLKQLTHVRDLKIGGFSQTYLYEDPDKHRIVLKKFKPNLINATSLKSLEMFKQECDRLFEVGDHAQIPSFLWFKEYEGDYYIAQEYIPGDTLRGQLDTEGPISSVKGLKLLEDLLQPLSYMHKQKMIHRDIKPENIIYSLATNKPTIVDFGTAKIATNTVLAQTGTVIGTANYAAPEQLARKVCFQSDIYSLGITIIEMITGINPFDQVDLFNGKPIWFSKANGISERFASILEKMTAPYLGDRYQSVKEIQKDIARLKAQTDQDFKEKVKKQQQRKETLTEYRNYVFKIVIPGALVTGIGVAAAIGAYNVAKEPISNFLSRDWTAPSVKPISEDETYEYFRFLLKIALAGLDLSLICLFIHAFLVIREGEQVNVAFTPFFVTLFFVLPVRIAGHSAGITTGQEQLSSIKRSAV